MFRALCAHHQEVKLYYTASGIVTLCMWPFGAQPAVSKTSKFRRLLKLMPVAT